MKNPWLIIYFCLSLVMVMNQVIVSWFLVIVGESLVVGYEPPFCQEWWTLSQQLANYISFVLIFLVATITLLLSFILLLAYWSVFFSSVLGFGGGGCQVELLQQVRSALISLRQRGMDARGPGAGRRGGYTQVGGSMAGWCLVGPWMVEKQQIRRWYRGKMG